MSTRDSGLRAFVAVTACLFSLRIVAMKTVGFGDSEALYASYALHPAPVYLDHPGLVGTVAALLGEGNVPTPERAHAATAVAATLVPWLAFATMKIAGAATRAAAVAALIFATVPEIAIGLFALTPDVLLAPLWLGALASALAAAKRPPGDAMGGALWLMAGLLAGTCAAAKASGILLPIALVVALTTPALRAHARSLWPWVGLALGAIVIFPMVRFEMQTGFSMLRHRLVESQAGGFSLRGLGAVTLGQLVYVAPFGVALAILVARDLWRRRFDDATSTILFFAFAIPGVVLAGLMIWSRTAEPHWLAPALLSLVVAGALTPPKAPRFLFVWAAPIGLVIVIAVHAWVLAPSTMAFARPADPKHDIANELFGWDEAERSVREMLAGESKTSDVVVIGPHWTVCAQIHARLGRAFQVGCATPIRDDFDVWLPRARWQRAEKILYVTDNRFPTEPLTMFPDRSASRRGRARVFRGGREVRTFTLTMLEGAARASRDRVYPGSTESAPDHNPITETGEYEVAVDPLPSIPCVFCPQHFTAAPIRTHVKWFPAAMLVTPPTAAAAIGVLENTGDADPLPSAP